LHYAVTLTFDPLILNVSIVHRLSVCHVIKLCSKFQRNRTIRG